MTPQFFIAVMDAWSLGPSKIPLPWTHAYSVPERSTPCSTTVCPLALTSLLPDTCSCGAGPLAVLVGDGVGVGVGEDEGEVVGVGVGVGPVPPLQAMPLRVKAVGAALVPL